MSKPTHISEYVDELHEDIFKKQKSRIDERSEMLKELEFKYGDDVNFKQLTKQELKDWISLFNKKRGNNENNN
tara:strand:- start:66 stop:284 length:219 start_codon:yes stop_codon:yes gene_type:complete